MPSVVLILACAGVLAACSSSTRVRTGWGSELAESIDSAMTPGPIGPGMPVVLPPAGDEPGGAAQDQAGTAEGGEMGSSVDTGSEGSPPDDAGEATAGAGAAVGIEPGEGDPSEDDAAGDDDMPAVRPLPGVGGEEAPLFEDLVPEDQRGPDAFCRDNCAHISGCLGSQCALPLFVTNDVYAGCVDGCEPGGIDFIPSSCEVVVTVLAEGDPNLAGTCDVDVPAVQGCAGEATCDDFARQLVDCKLRDCANPDAERYRASLEGLYHSFCRESEECPSESVARLLLEDAEGCDAGWLLGNEDDPAEAVCGAGRSASFEDVATACDKMVRCELDMRDSWFGQDACQVFLAADDANAPLARCVAAQPVPPNPRPSTCYDLIDCFEPEEAMSRP